jgi:CxxC-x17-CxxC domain-containing protein
MRNFDNKYRGDSNRGDFKKGGYRERQFGNNRDRDRERPQMHEAICSDCGKRCEVPFRPSGDKPVYCSQCFSAHRENSAPNNFEKRGYEKPRFQDKDRTVNQSSNQYKEQFEALNAKLDGIIKVLKMLTPAVPEKEEKEIKKEKEESKGKEEKQEKKDKKNKKEKHEKI